jgi:N utilization substance protein A
MVVNSVFRTIDEISAEFPNLSKDIVVDVLEKCFHSLVRSEYGDYENVFVSMDKVGNFVAYRNIKVVNNGVDYDIVTEMPISDACKIVSNCVVGDEVSEELPIDLYKNRKALDIMKKDIASGIRSENKKLEYNLFKPKEGELISGDIIRVSYSGVIVAIGGGKYEAIMPKNHSIQGEKYKINDKIIASIHSVQRSDKDPQITISRSSVDFLISSLYNTIDEIKEGLVVIEGVAREAGSKAKIIVSATDKTVDPVGSCIGVKGIRIKKISEEVGGDKIDVISHSHDLKTLIQNAIRPVHANKIDVQVDDLGKKKIVIVVDEQFVSILIGRRGQNVRLLSQAIGDCEISVMSADDYKQKSDEKMANSVKLIVDGLDVDETIATILVHAKYTILFIAKSNPEDIAKLPNFNLEIARELKDRALQFISNEANYSKEILNSFPFLDSRVIELDISLDVIYKIIAECGIYSLEKLINFPQKTLSQILSLSEDVIFDLINDAKDLAGAVA